MRTKTFDHIPKFIFWLVANVSRSSPGIHSKVSAVKSIYRRYPKNQQHSKCTLTMYASTKAKGICYVGLATQKHLKQIEKWTK